MGWVVLAESDNEAISAAWRSSCRKQHMVQGLPWKGCHRNLVGEAGIAVHGTALIRAVAYPAGSHPSPAGARAKAAPAARCAELLTACGSAPLAADLALLDAAEAPVT